MTNKQADINRMNEEKAQYEQKIQNLSEDIQRLEQDNANKREEIKNTKLSLRLWNYNAHDIELGFLNDHLQSLFKSPYIQICFWLVFLTLCLDTSKPLN